MATYGLMIDNEYCTGCHTCEIACRNELGLPQGQWGIKLLEMGPWRKPDGTWEGKYVPVPTTSCNLCESWLRRCPNAGRSARCSCRERWEPGSRHAVGNGRARLLSSLCGAGAWRVRRELGSALDSGFGSQGR